MIHEKQIIFPGKIFSTTLMFPIVKIKFSVAEILKIIFQKETFFSNNNMRRFFTYFQIWKQLSRKESFPGRNKP